MSALRLNSLFRIQSIMILASREENGISGYDLAKELLETTGTKPSSGKIYPFLHQLLENEYIEELDIEEESDRSRKVYRMTAKGLELVDDLLDRMSSILDARLEYMLDSCNSCGVKIFESKVVGVDTRGKDAYFCCGHCKQVYYTRHNIEN